MVAKDIWPLLPLVKLLRSLFLWFKPIIESKVIPANYFDKHGYIGNTNQMKEVFPEFEPPTMGEYLKHAFNSEAEKMNSTRS